MIVTLVIFLFDDFFFWKIRLPAIPMMSATASESVNIMRWLTSQMTDGSDANKVVEIKKAMAAQRKMSDTIIATGQETIRRA